MTDERFEQWLREQSQSYNRPPMPDAEAMWAEIEHRHFDARKPAAAPWWTNSWMRVAAALILGIGLGRVSLERSASDASRAPSVAAADSVTHGGTTVVSDPSTLRYIGQTVALLASFESDAPAIRGDTAMKSRAKELLHSTRLLLDSPGATDPVVYALLEDLELVLVQIVQMQPKRNASDVELIKEAMEQREVMPRLIAAATNTSAE